MRLEISCKTSITITRHLLDLLHKRGAELTGIESSGDSYIYLSLHEMDLGCVQQLLSQFRRIEGVLDVRIVQFMPSEIEQSEVQLLMDNVPFPVALVDGAGVIAIANQAFEYAVGDEPRQVQGCEMSRFIKGFSLNRWFIRGAEVKDTVTLHLNGRVYQADITRIGDTSAQQSCGGVMLLFRPNSWLGSDESLNLPEIDFSEAGLVVGGVFSQKAVRQIQEIAQDPYPLLLFGESGVGKRFYGQLLNQMAGFNKADMAVLDCLQVNIWDEQSLLDAVGHSKAVILDRIELLTGEQLQAVAAVFSRSTHRVRIVVYCSELSPAQLSELWTEDVFFRVVAGSLEILPLRFRKEEIVPLAESWLKAHFDRQQVVAPPLSRAVKRYLVEQNWPGNVAQLWHVLRDTINDIGNARWQIKDIKYQNTGTAVGVDLETLLGNDYHTAMNQFERLLISHHYPHYPSTRLLAKKLGLSHTAIANKLRDHNIR